MRPSECLWNDTAAPAPETAALEAAIRADVAVVGAGYTGLSAALHLAEAGADVAVVETHAPGSGASGRNQGQVVPVLSKYDPDGVVRRLGPERGERLNAWVAGSADLVFDLIRRHRIDCDAVQRGWLLPVHRASRLGAVEGAARQWADRGVAVEMLDADRARDLIGSVHWCAALLHPRGGNLNPLGYVRGLARAALGAGARIFTESPAIGLDRAGGQWRVRTPAGSVLAPSVVLATNGYTGSLWPGLDRSIVPFRLYQAATEALSDNVRKTILPGGHGLSDSRRALWAFRLDRDGRLLTGERPLFTVGSGAALRRAAAARLRTAFPQLGDVRIGYAWSGLVAMTPDRLPRLHEPAPGLHAGLGYNGRGIALATAMGKLIAQRIAGLAEADLPLAPSEVRALPLHGLVAPLSRSLIVYYRWRDRRD